MGWVDLVLLGILVVSVLLGLWRGLVFEVLSILGWVVAYFACPFFAPFIANWLPQDKLTPNLLHALSLVLAFMLILLLWGLSARLLRALIHATPLSIIDRVLGAGFGVLRGVLIGLLAVVLVSMTPAARSAPWQESQVAPWLQAALHLLTPVLPAEVLKFIPV